MNQTRRPILAVVVLCLMLTSQPLAAQTVPDPVAETPLPTVTLPPALDRVLRDYERAWRAGDAARLASLFTEDGFVLQSGSLPIRGRPAIHAAYETQGGGGPLRLRALAFAADARIAYVIGAYRDDTRPGFSGKFTLTLRRAPGGPWRIFSDMDNTDATPRR